MTTPLLLGTSEEVSEEEDAGAEAVDAFREFEVAEHLQLGEADVDAVDVGDDVGEEQDRRIRQAILL